MHNIESLLINNKLKEDLAKVIYAVYESAKINSDNKEDGHFDVLSCNLYLEQLAEISGLFYKLVFEKMQKPWRILPPEICHSFFSIYFPGEKLLGLKEPNFDELYTVFINTVSNEILSFKISEPFFVCWAPIQEEEILPGGEIENIEYASHLRHLRVQDHVDMHTLWNKNQIRIEYRFAERSSYAGCEREISLFISGNISKNVLAQLGNELKRLLFSIAESLDSLSMISGKMFHFSDISELFGKSPVELPAISNFESQKSIISDFLDIYFSQPGKKDTMERRIRNGLILMTEADAQKNKMVSLVLLTSSMEALLGLERGDLTKQLSERVGVLLEQDIKTRTKVAKSAIKAIYDKRSKAVHGEYLEEENLLSSKVRILASMILITALKEHVFRLSCGGKSDESKEWLNELTDIYFDNGQPIIKGDYDLRNFWDEILTICGKSEKK